MKYCKNCNKVFKEEAIFCPECGAQLDKAVEYDIFGEPMEERVRVNAYNNQYRSSQTSTENIMVSRKNTQTKTSEIFALISIGTWLIPFYGSIISVFALVQNVNRYKEDKTRLPYLIISSITLALSIIWIVVVLKTGVLQDMANNVIPQDPPSENL